MLKAYWNHETARYMKHPYIYTAITAVAVLHIIAMRIEHHQYMKEMYPKK